MKSALASFESKYIPEPMSGCWLWAGPPGSLPEKFGSTYDLRRAPSPEPFLPLGRAPHAPGHVGAAADVEGIMILKFLLLALDLIAACDGFGSSLYLWVLGLAAGRVEW